MSDYDTALLKQSALSRLPDIAMALFAHRPVESTRNEIRIGNNGSLWIDRGNGIFKDHESGEHGDVLSLIQYALACDFKSAKAWLNSFLGEAYTPPPNQIIKQPTTRLRGTVERRKKALEKWRQSQPITGTLAERYLREHRAIALGTLAVDLRFHPSLWHYKEEQSFPALVAALRGGDGNIIAVHGIFLDLVTGNKAKLSSGSSKLSFASIAGASVRLGNHSGGEARLAICEGIEDGLSIMQLTGCPVWAVCGAGNFKQLLIPDSVTEIVICADRNAAGSPADKATKAFASKLQREGRNVSITPPPEGSKDWNEHLQKQKASAGTPATIIKETV